MVESIRWANVRARTLVATLRRQDSETSNPTAAGLLVIRLKPSERSLPEAQRAPGHPDRPHAHDAAGAEIHPTVKNRMGRREHEEPILMAEQDAA